MQAVIDINSAQYLVSPGQVIEVDRLDADPDTTITYSQVLLLVDGETVTVGKPHLDSVSVDAKVISHKKGDKIRVGKFKAKSRYRKVRGFRASLTQLKILDIRVK